ncbi:heparinase II/III-family protein [Vibrio sp. TBV020]|uniref:heparinase II/III family protein n=1 Tax=Vibrio sp. TBV020 TaxID=3137398 RepID=UPI0038CD7EF5
MSGLNLSHPVSTGFDVFAIEPLYVTSIPKDYWHCDHRTHDHWSTKWHSLLPYKLLGESDVKVPWELGRGQCFTQLAYYLAANQSGNEQLKKVINEFRALNPVGYGVQWQCSMDVSIRLVNLIHSMSIMGIGIEPESDIEMAQCLSEHYSYIHSNPEVFDNGFRNNHYLADLMGRIFYLSLFSDKYAEATALFEEMLDEFDNQFLSDGGNFEGSTAYHFLSLEMVVLSISIYAHICVLRGKAFGIERLSRVREKLLAAVKFAHNACSITGYPSRVGDDDSGMVIRSIDLSTVELAQRNRYVAQQRLIAFEAFISELSKEWSQHSYCRVFSAFLGVSSDTAINIDGDEPYVSFPEFGLYKFSHQGFELWFRHIEQLGCSGKGGHNHCDDGSIELYIDGVPCIVESGTYCYTSNANKRNYYRSDKQHNVVVADDRKPFHFTLDDKMLFELKEQPDTHSSVEATMCSISHQTNRNGISQTRNIDLKSGQLEISDYIEVGDGVLNLTLYPDIKPEVDGHNIRLAPLDIVIEHIGSKSVEVVDRVYSDYYLNERSCKALKITFTEYVRLKIKREL